MSSNPKDARDLLAFYVEAGADALLGEEATDRMADEVTASPAPAGGRPDSEAIRAGASNPRAAIGNGPTPNRLQRPVPPPAGEGKALVSPDAAIMAASGVASTLPSPAGGGPDRCKRSRVGPCPEAVRW